MRRQRWRIREQGGLASVRRDLARWLHEGGIGARDVEQLVLVVNEIATNGVEAGRRTGSVDVHVEAGSASGVVAVRVRNVGEPFRSMKVPSMPAQDEPRGRGLALASRLSDRLEVNALVGGTEVQITWVTNSPRP